MKEKYEQALERAKNMIDNLRKGEDILAVSELEAIFPELKESEDERIRKDIISYVKRIANTSNISPEQIKECNAWIAWLEKQKAIDVLDEEEREFADNIDSFRKEIDAAHQKGYNEGVRVTLEKQIKQKPIMNVPSREIILSIWDLGNEWKELTNTTGAFSTKYGTQLDYIQKHWHESEYYLKAKQGEQKLTDNIEPKFKVKYAGGEYNVLKVKDINDVIYYGIEDELNHIDYVLPNNCEIISEQNPAIEMKSAEESLGIDSVTYNKIVDECIYGDNIEPKFMPGDWIISKYMHLVMQILNNDNGSYKTVETDGTERNDSYDFIERNFKFWTIQDAKKGDILQANNCTLIFNSLTKDIDNKTAISSWYFCDSKRFYGIGTSGPDLWDIEGVVPATKEQRDVLFQKMHEAGYEWNAEKKESKKIEHPIQETEPFEAEHGKYYYCIKDYFCGGRKQASKGDVIQALRGLPIMGLKDASEYFLPVNFIKCNSIWNEEDEEIKNFLIALVEWSKSYISSGVTAEEAKTALNWLKSLKVRVQPQPKQEWSEEDVRLLDNCISLIEDIDCTENEQNWLKSIKNRVIPQPQQEWSEEDERTYKSIIYSFAHNYPLTIQQQEFVKFLKHQNRWKPSDEQMEALANALSLAKNCGEENAFDLRILYEQLKKLREE